MHSIVMAAHRAALSRRSFLLASTVLASILPLSLPAIAQQSASPDLTLPEVVVSPPVVRPRIQAPPRQPSSAPPRTELPANVAAPEANAPVVYSPTAVVTPARDIATAAHQFYQRGEAVWSLLDGRFVNYFGINYTDAWNWNKAPDPAAANVTNGER